MRKAKKKICVICRIPGPLMKAGPVCPSCYSKATQPKIIQISEKAAEKMGHAYALANFFQWGVQKLIEAAGLKMPFPPQNAEQAERLQREAREHLEELRKRFPPS